MAPDGATNAELLGRLSLGLIFLASGLAKLRDPAAFVRAVLEYRVLPAPLARAYGLLLPFAELGAALLLLSGNWPLVAAGVMVLMLTSFTVALAVTASRGQALACHCFGAASAGHVGWHSLVRTVALLGPACWLLVKAMGGATRPTPLDPAVLAPATAAGVLLALTYLLASEGLDLFFGAASTKRKLARQI